MRRLFLPCLCIDNFVIQKYRDSAGGYITVLVADGHRGICQVTIFLYFALRIAISYYRLLRGNGDPVYNCPSRLQLLYPNQ